MSPTVLRKPCFQEDEGRHEYLGTFETRAMADAFIEKYTDHDRGFFKKSDLEIQETVNQSA